MFRFTNYIPVLLAFMLAVLVKVTIIPIIALFILMLTFKVSLSVTKIGKRCFVALLYMFLSGSICAVMLFLFYGLFWFGHSIKSIMYIFSSQPESTGNFNSLFSALQFCITFRILPDTFTPITNLHFWNIIIYGGMALVLIFGGICLRRTPTIQKVIFVGSYNLHTHPQHIGWLIVCYVLTFTLPVLTFLVFFTHRTRNAFSDHASQ